MNQLQNLLGGQLAQNYYPYQYLPVKDNRPAKEILLDKLAHNENIIKNCQSEIDTIKEALSLLDEHPMIARLQDLLRRLIG